MDDCLGYPHDYGTPQSLAGTTLCAPGQNGQWDIQWPVLIQQVWNLDDYITTDSICILCVYVYIYIYIYYCLGNFVHVACDLHLVRGFPMARPSKNPPATPRRGSSQVRYQSRHHRWLAQGRSGGSWWETDQKNLSVNGWLKNCTLNETLVHQQRGQVNHIFQYIYADRGWKWVSYLLPLLPFTKQLCTDLVLPDAPNGYWKDPRNGR